MKAAESARHPRRLPSFYLRERKIMDTIVERYKQAVRTGLLSEVMQEGAAVLGALLLRCPLSVRVR